MFRYPSGKFSKFAGRNRETYLTCTVGRKAIIAEEVSGDWVDDDEEEEDDYMRLFVQYFRRKVRISFRQLRAHSIRTWNEIITIFKNQWGVKKDHVYFLTEFEELKRNTGELVVEFIKRFNKLYHKMPVDRKPPVAAAKVRYSKAFEDDFVFMLRERVSNTLEDMHTNSI